MNNDPNLCPFCHSLCVYVMAGADCPVKLQLEENAENNKTPHTDETKPKRNNVMWSPTLDFLIANAEKEFTPEKWAELLGVKICDPDGWRGSSKTPNPLNYGDPHPLPLFIKRLKSSTIAPAE